ncbi:MAG: hypothetical protein ACHQUC_01765 [Chlamydiales bacterium]
MFQVDLLAGSISATLGTLGETVNHRSEKLDFVFNTIQSVGAAFIALSFIPGSLGLACGVSLLTLTMGTQLYVHFNPKNRLANCINHLVLTAVKVINIVAAAKLMVHHFLTNAFFSLATLVVTSTVALQAYNILHNICDRLLDAKRTSRTQTFHQYRLSHLNELSIPAKLVACLART